MPGKASDSRVMQVVGAAVAGVAVVGHFVFGWQFGDVSDPVPIAVGLIAAALAIGWTLSRR